MRILVTGRSGQVGWELARVLPALGEVIALDRPAFDLANPDQMVARLRELRPVAICNAAAYTAVDHAEAEPEAAERVNGIAPGILAEEARRLGALLVQYSTDYVFDGTKRGPYVEEDAPNPLGAYGRSKLAGERAIQASGCRHLILRTSWVYGARGKNFLRTILRLAREGRPLRVVDDQVGAPTWCAEIAAATAALLALAARGSVQGLFHLTAAGSTSWCGFAREILVRAGEAARPQPIPASEYPTPARRPANSVLSNAKLARETGIALAGWQDALARCIAAGDPETGRPV